MRHTGWPEDTRKLHQVDGTWASIMPELKRLLETGDDQPRHARPLPALLGFMWAMPGKTRTENVPAPPELSKTR